MASGLLQLHCVNMNRVRPRLRYQLSAISYQLLAISNQVSASRILRVLAERGAGGIFLR